jgi:phage RecT family recombinase
MKMNERAMTTSAPKQRQLSPVEVLEQGFENRRAIIASMLSELGDHTPQTNRIFATAGAKYRAMLNASDKPIDPLSVVDCVVQAAQLGLEAGSDQAYLVPYKGKIQLIVSPRGLIDLAFRHPAVQDVEAEVVRKGDRFEYELGDKPFIKHTKGTSVDKSGGDLLFAYAVIRLVNGGVIRAVLTAAEVNFYRGFSKSTSGPWFDNTAAMWRKTALKRAFAKAPRSLQMAQAMVENDLGHYVPPGADERSAPGPRAVTFLDAPATEPLKLEAHEIPTPPPSEPAGNAEPEHVVIPGGASFAAAGTSKLLAMLTAGRQAGQAADCEHAFAQRIAVLAANVGDEGFEPLRQLAIDSGITPDSPHGKTMKRALDLAVARLDGAA